MNIKIRICPLAPLGTNCYIIKAENGDAEAQYLLGAHYYIGIGITRNKKQIERMVTMCGASLPNKFVKMMARYENNPEALKDAAIAYAVDQIVDLVAQGVDGIHLYTMNKPDTAKRIYNCVASLFKC